MAFRIPEESADDGHDDQLVEVEPALHEHRTERLHDELVIKAADYSHECCQADAPDPLIALEVNVFLLAGAAHQEDRSYGQNDTDPLVGVKPFAEDQHCSNKHEYGSGGIDGTYDGQRQMFQPEISADP